MLPDKFTFYTISPNYLYLARRINEHEYDICNFADNGVHAVWPVHNIELNIQDGNWTIVEDLSDPVPDVNIDNLL